MAITIPSINKIAERWVRGAGQGASNYRDGVSNTSVDWEGPTARAEQTWSTAVAEAAAAGRFGNGVQKAGTSKWRERSVTLGSQRFASGVAAAADDYQRNFQPYRDLIAGLDLPPRGPRGSASNLERVRAVTDALHQERLRQVS